MTSDMTQCSRHATTIPPGHLAGAGTRPIGWWAAHGGGRNVVASHADRTTCMTLPLLNQISDKLQSAAGSRHVVAVRNSAHQHISGVLWQEQSVVTSDQAVSGRDRYEIVTPGGDAVPARIAGRDAATNLLLLTTERPIASSPVV